VKANRIVRSAAALLLALGIYVCAASAKSADVVSVKRGAAVYHTACAACHGNTGKGDGPVSVSLTTKPRDFQKGVYKFRTTASGQLPTDHDLLWIVNSGIYHTAMPSFAQMSVADQYSVVEYLKTLSHAFSDPSQYPLDTVKVGHVVPYTFDSVERGRGIYLQMRCWNCHGISGEGNGPAASTVTDDEGRRLEPTNLTYAWDLKVARTPERIYMIFTTGVNGTPMPSFAQILTDTQRWDLANYVYALSHADRYYEGTSLEAVSK
jgi:cytochrome c oxidase cbb3-type subunit 2